MRPQLHPQELLAPSPSPDPMAPQSAQQPEIQQLRPGLFIGTQKVCAQKPLLEALGVTHVLSMIGSAPDWPGEFQHYAVHAKDDDHTELLKTVLRACCFMREGIEGGGAVLVYCRRGVNQSGAMAIAYLMREERLPYVKVGVAATPSPVRVCARVQPRASPQQLQSAERWPCPDKATLMQNGRGGPLALLRKSSPPPPPKKRYKNATRRGRAQVLFVCRHSEQNRHDQWVILSRKISEKVFWLPKLNGGGTLWKAPERVWVELLVW